MDSDLSHIPKVCVAWRQMKLLTAALPLFSFISAVFIAVVWHFDRSTWTECRVPNYLPSASAAIGGDMPEKFIWRAGIALHCLPRILLFTVMFYYHYKNTPSGRIYYSTTWWFKWLNLFSSTLHVVENGALITLTYVSSTENFDVHEISFITFMVCSMCYMLLACVLFKLTANHPISFEETRVFRKMICTMLFNYSSFGLAVACYFRHNQHCEPGMYTLFALLEYCTILSNIAFHWISQWHFRGVKLTVSYGDMDNSKNS